MINQFIGVGRLTADAELKYSSSGNTVTKFSICINDSYKKNDAWQERPYFFNCVIWGKYAEAMTPYLTKGRLIGVIGKLTHNPWKDGNGANHNDCSIVISNIHLFPKPGTNPGNNHQENRPEAPPPQDGFVDEIPF